MEKISSNKINWRVKSYLQKPPNNQKNKCITLHRSCVVYVYSRNEDANILSKYYLLLGENLISTFKQQDLISEGKLILTWVS